jgi:hypothetical protein
MKPELYLPRLSFIRYLYTQGVDQSRQPRPQSASILSFHDSVELLLDLVCDFIGTDRAKEFLDYWSLLQKKIPTMLGHKRDMVKLNKIRVGLKHQGIFPPIEEIGIAANNVTSFMEDIVLTVFKINFEEISMTDLIQNMKCKEKLDLAIRETKARCIDKTLLSIAIAFQELINEYEKKRTKEYGSSSSTFTHDEYVRRSTGYETEEGLLQLVETIASLQNTVQIMTLGIDYQKYSRFKLLTPEVYPSGEDWTPDIVYQLFLENPNSRPEELHKPTQEDCRFCIDFVIETALRLQAS